MFQKALFYASLLLIFSCNKDCDGINITTKTEYFPIAKCENGMAGDYPCDGYDLLTHISIEDLGANNSSGNDCWGWADPETDKEYAIMCTNYGTIFVDITDPANATILGTLKTQTVNSSWRDVKVFNSYAYIVSEANSHGMQVFDLKRLRDVTNPPVDFTTDYHYPNFTRAHNIVINEDSGYAYVVGSNIYAGGPHFIDLNTELLPTSAGGYASDTYSHDAQVITYNGPDTDYSGAEILIGSNENEVVIIDVTDKSNPTKISSINYSNIGYTHQGWFTEDLTYFILGDELDERNFGGNTRTIVFDFTDLDNPTYHMDYEGPTAAIDHNGYVKGSTYYQANYTGGVRMIDVSDIENKSMNEIGFFDTYPENNNANFSGVWSVYPYLPSGNIIISDINRGLFIVRKSGS